MDLTDTPSRTASAPRVVGWLALAGVSLIIAARWWRTFEWGSRERLRYSWALKARLAGRYAWGRPAGCQPVPDVSELDSDLASAAQDVNAFERRVIGYRARRTARP